MDKIHHFNTRYITDSKAGNLEGMMELTTDDSGHFLVNITSGDDGAGIYLDRDARKELIAILLKTL